MPRVRRPRPRRLYLGLTSNAASRLGFVAGRGLCRPQGRSDCCGFWVDAGVRPYKWVRGGLRQAGTACRAPTFRGGLRSCYCWGSNKPKVKTSDSPAMVTYCLPSIIHVVGEA